MSGCLERFGVVGVIIFSIVHTLYFLLFLASLVVLFRRAQTGTRSSWLFLSTILLFVSATTFLVVQLVIPEFSLKNSSLVGIPTIALGLATVLTADIVIIHRCYIIWESRKAVIAVPIFLLFASTTLGATGGGLALAAVRNKSREEAIRLLHASGKLIGVFIGMLFTTSFLVTVLSAGRVLWLARQVTPKNARQRYHTISAVVLESGMIYCAAEMVFFIVYVVYASKSLADVIEIAGVLVVESAGIAPTLLIVRSASMHSTVRKGSLVTEENATAPTGLFTTQRSIDSDGAQYTADGDGDGFDFSCGSHRCSMDTAGMEKSSLGRSHDHR